MEEEDEEELELRSVLVEEEEELELRSVLWEEEESWWFVGVATCRSRDWLRLDDNLTTMRLRPPHKGHNVGKWRAAGAVEYMTDKECAPPPPPR